MYRTERRGTLKEEENDEKEGIRGKRSLTGCLLYLVVVFKPGYLRLWDAGNKTAERAGAADGHCAITEACQEAWCFLI